MIRNFITRNDIKSFKWNGLKKLVHSNSSIKIDEYSFPEKPTWSVRSLLPPFFFSNTPSKPIITQEEYKTLLKLSNLRPFEDSQLFQDINLLCYFVKHNQEVDVTNVEPMRGILADKINLNLHEVQEGEENEKVRSENQGKELLKRASVLHKEFYVVKTGDNNN